MTREFVDGVLDVVLADRASQFSYVVGSPGMYRGSVQQQQQQQQPTSSSSSPEDSNNNNNNSDQNISNHSDPQNGPNAKISNALLHASLLCGVVESHGKVAFEQHMNNISNNSSGNLNNNIRGSSSTQSMADNGSSSSQQQSGFIRPPHYPRLVRNRNVVPLTKTAISPTCPIISRTVQSPAPTPLTKSQINASKALNEGCVALSSNSPHAWLHPSIAPCSTEPVTDWILSYEPQHHKNQAELKRERLQSYLNLVQQNEKLRAEFLQQQSGSPTISSTQNSNEKLIPSVFYFPWRIFGDSLGAVYCIFSAGPNVPIASNNIAPAEEKLFTANNNNNSKSSQSRQNDNNNNQQSIINNTLSPSSQLKKKNSFSLKPSGSSATDLVAAASTSSFAVSASQQGNFLTNDSFAGFFGGGGGNNNNNAASFQQQQNFNNGIPSANTALLAMMNLQQPKHFHHEENMPAVKQSMSNLFVLLCDAFKTTKSAEAPTCKNLISNLDQVHECVEIVCPGNGRCLPVFDTAMARKVWKMRNEFSS